MKSASKEFTNENGAAVVIMLRYEENNPSEFYLIMTRDFRMVVGNSSMTLMEMRVIAELSEKVLKESYPDRRHPSHITRASDASSFDEVCNNCGHTDIAVSGWGELRYPCRSAHRKDNSITKRGVDAFKDGVC